MSQIELFRNPNSGYTIDDHITGDDGKVYIVGERIAAGGITTQTWLGVSYLHFYRVGQFERQNAVVFGIYRIITDARNSRKKVAPSPGRLSARTWPPMRRTALA